MPDAERYSFLIDAGVDVHGYASDITRTWAWRRGEFADLIAALDAQQQEIIDEIKPAAATASCTCRCTTGWRACCKPPN